MAQQRELSRFIQCIMSECVCLHVCVWIFIAALKCNTLKRNAKTNLKVQRFRHSLLSCTQTHRRINLLPFRKLFAPPPSSFQIPFDIHGGETSTDWYPYTPWWLDRHVGHIIDRCVTTFWLVFNITLISLDFQRCRFVLSFLFKVCLPSLFFLLCNWDITN